MEKDARRRVTDAIREIFNLDAGRFPEETRLNAIADWDSFRNLMLIMRLQEELGTKFTTLDLENTVTIGDIYKLAERKTKR